MEKFKKWDNCSFKGLLAEGAFEVDAERINGTTRWVKIRSLAGNRVKIRNPFGNIQVKEDEGITLTCPSSLSIKYISGNREENVRYSLECDCISFETFKGVEYMICPCLCTDGNVQSCMENKVEYVAKEEFPKVHEAHTHRRVYLGKNEDTQFIKMLDKFTFDYYSGNYRESPTSIYRLDFGITQEVLPKDYRQILPPQVHLGGNMGQDFIRIATSSAFSAFKGWGWDSAENISHVDRGGPDEFRRDFITGDNTRIFYIELPKGRYDILFVSGDSEASSYTEISIEGQCAWKPEGILQAGEFITEILPVVQRKDGYLKIEFNSCRNYKWVINMMIINKYYTFL